MKVRILVLVSLLMTGTLFAQQDWSKVDFTKEYKGKVKMNKASVQSLQENKTFVNGYTISQATVMKGSEQSATKAVYSEVALAGINNDDFQQMVDDLYKEFMLDLADAGMKPTEGDDVLATEFVKAKLAKAKKDEYIGSTGDSPAYEGKKKIQDGSIPGYGAGAVIRDVSFPARNKNIYQTSNILKSGNFYLKLATGEGYNLLGINFYITFASFDGGKGYKDIKLSTQPVMAVSATISLVNASGGSCWVTYDKLPVWASADWSEGMDKGKDNQSDAEFLGLARSAEYEITANSDKYLAEARAIISNLQKDIVKLISSEF